MLIGNSAHKKTFNMAHWQGLKLHLLNLRNGQVQSKQVNHGYYSMEAASIRGQWPRVNERMRKTLNRKPKTMATDQHMCSAYRMPKNNGLGPPNTHMHASAHKGRTRTNSNAHAHASAHKGIHRWQMLQGQ